MQGLNYLRKLAFFTTGENLDISYRKSRSEYLIWLFFKPGVEVLVKYNNNYLLQFLFTEAFETYLRTHQINLLIIEENKLPA